MARKKGYLRAVPGAQWGDEGKGKIVDFAAQDADVVCRFAGGGNAGHTVENDQGKFKTRITPVGVFSTKTQLNVIGRGTVPSLGVLVEEFEVLSEQGIDVTSVVMDKAAHLVMPWHVLEDVLDEEIRGEQSLGTTKSGIGPAYSDKYLRTGLRAGDLLDFNKFRTLFWETWTHKIQRMGPYYNRHFDACEGCKYCMPVRSLHTTLHEIEGQIQYLANLFGSLDRFIKDTPSILLNAIDEGQNILLEGAQGYLLSIDHGSYPYVTSSNTGAAAAAEGVGIPPSAITEVIGVAKAYMSKVGSGPFPTRAHPHEEEQLRDLGKEFGTVTGRARACGWFDPILFKMAADMNGFTSCAITRLDILDSLDIIGIGDGYVCKEGPGLMDLNGHCTDPSHALDPKREATALIDWVDGWGPERKVTACESWGDLPQEARRYLKRITCGVPIKWISRGAHRDDTIVV